jgi:hypothetical protein
LATALLHSSTKLAKPSHLQLILSVWFPSFIIFVQRDEIFYWSPLRSPSTNFGSSDGISPGPGDLRTVVIEGSAFLNCDSDHRTV